MSDVRFNPIGKISIIALIVFLLAISALTYTSITGRGFWGANKDAGQVIQSSSLTDLSDNWYNLYFSNPQDPEARTWRNGPDVPLAEAIRSARLSVDMAAYDLDLWSLREALLSAHRGGVTVRLVIDSDNQDKPEIQALIQGGIPVRGDLREGLMHNKFVIIDQMEVWTGSMNFTINGSYRNNNNLIGIGSPQLAEDYLSEFEEMFHDDLFGLGSPANTPHPHLFHDGVSLEVYFSPEDGTAARLEQLIGKAQKSIDFLAYAFTSDGLAGAMVERAQVGVKVSGVIEASQCTASRGCEYDRMKSSGLMVRLDGNPNEMHHKVIVIDHQVVVTGSYNFSASAETRNDENTLILDDADIAAQYLVEFRKIFDQAKP
jgi:phosphatidylserine/phosphatidylglycerophosphate/cardiolipin synthase-like enzyme